MITKLLMGLVTRDAEAFVAFVERLQTKVDAIIHRHATEIGKVQAYIDQSHEEYHAALEALRVRMGSAQAELEAEYSLELDRLNSWLDREVLSAQTEIDKIKAKISKVQAAASAVAKI